MRLLGKSVSVVPGTNGLPLTTYVPPMDDYYWAWPWFILPTPVYNAGRLPT